MKYWLALFLTSLTQSQPVWYTNFTNANKMAVEDNRLMLLNFSGSDWCDVCTAWGKQIFVSNTFKQLVREHLILVNADYPRYGKNYLPKDLQQQYEVLMIKYNPQKQFPYTLLLDAKGRKLKEWNLSQTFSREKFMQEITAAVKATNSYSFSNKH